MRECIIVDVDSQAVGSRYKHKQFSVLCHYMRIQGYIDIKSSPLCLPIKYNTKIIVDDTYCESDSQLLS
jgi:hypothetical protein